MGKFKNTLIWSLVVTALLFSQNIDIADSKAMHWRTVDGKVTKVYDGDTIQVRFNGKKHRVRLAGYNAMEKGQCTAKTATSLLRSVTLGQDVTLRYSGKKSRGRLVAYVYANGQDVSNFMLSTGYTHLLFFSKTGTESNYQYFQTWKQASDAGLGLYSKHTCDKSNLKALSAIEGPVIPQDLLTIKARWKKPEKIKIKNNGDQPVNISGWHVKDDALNFWYIPKGTVIEPGKTYTIKLHGKSRITAPNWDPANFDGDGVYLFDKSGNMKAWKAW